MACTRLCVYVLGGVDFEEGDELDEEGGDVCVCVRACVLGSGRHL